MKSFLDDFYDVLFNPQKGLARVAGEKSIWHGLLVYMLVTFIVSLTTLDLSAAPAGAAEILPPDVYHLLPPQVLELSWKLLPLLAILLQLVFGPLYFFLRVAVLSLVSELFGGSARVSSLGAVFGYAFFPYLLLAVGGLLERYTSFNLAPLLSVVAFSWSLWLRLAGLKQVNGFSWGRSVLVYFMPLLALFLALLLLLLLGIVFVLPLVLQVWEGQI